MSDSELSQPSTTPAPPDHELEKSLRREVAKAHKAELDYSVNDIRAASEEKLGLQQGFYKNHGEWAKRSKDVIKDQIVHWLPQTRAMRKTYVFRLSCRTPRVLR